MKTDVPEQEVEIKEVKKKLKLLNLVETLDQLSITNVYSNMLDIFISVLLLQY